MDIDNLKQLGEPCLSFNAMPARISKTLSWLVLPDKICLMSTSHLYRGILCQVKARSNDFQRRIDLNSNILITASQGQRLFDRILSNSTYMQQYWRICFCTCWRDSRIVETKSLRLVEQAAKE